MEKRILMKICYEKEATTHQLKQYLPVDIYSSDEQRTECNWRSLRNEGWQLPKGHSSIYTNSKQKYNQTFGFPVVPLEKFKNASFFLASPALSRLSTKLGSLLNPSEINSSNVAYGAPGAELAGCFNSTIRSAEISVIRAAERAIFKASG